MSKEGFIYHCGTYYCKEVGKSGILFNLKRVRVRFRELSYPEASALLMPSQCSGHKTVPSDKSICNLPQKIRPSLPHSNNVSDTYEPMHMFSTNNKIPLHMELCASIPVFRLDPDILVLLSCGSGQGKLF